MRTELFIGGEWRESSSGESETVINPATGEEIARAPRGTADDIDDAVEAARTAYEEEWRTWDAREIGNRLLELASIIEEHADELAELETRENGKPLHEAENDLEGTVGAFRYYGGAADKFHGDTIPKRDDIVDLQRYEPYGVVGIIIPWNWPPMHVADFVAPALACGNTIVLKPAPETPLSALRIAELFEDHLPDGVFNVVTGGVDPGAALTTHDAVDKLAFTGNSDTGRLVLESASQNLTSAMMELGGKNPNIVFPDADMDAAVEGAVGGAFYNTGEACTSGERLLVHEDIYEEFVDQFVEATREQVRLGDGLDPETSMGPLSSQNQYEKVREYIEIGKDEATLRYAGEMPDDDRLSDGYFVAPHVFVDVSPDDRLFQEEVFGPVIAVTPFADEQEAVELANAVDYGLAAGIWTADSERAMRLAELVEAGMIYLNNYNREMLGAPFGGYKDSGLGRKLGFEETMTEFSQVKNIRYSVGAQTGLRKG